MASCVERLHQDLVNYKLHFCTLGLMDKLYATFEEWKNKGLCQIINNQIMLTQLSTYEEQDPEDSFISP